MSRSPAWLCPALPHLDYVLDIFWKEKWTSSSECGVIWSVSDMAELAPGILGPKDRETGPVRVTQHIQASQDPPWPSLGWHQHLLGQRRSSAAPAVPEPSWERGWSQGDPLTWCWGPEPGERTRRRSWLPGEVPEGRTSGHCRGVGSSAPSPVLLPLPRPPLLSPVCWDPTVPALEPE